MKKEVLEDFESYIREVIRLSQKCQDPQVFVPAAEAVAKLMDTYNRVSHKS